MVEASVEGVVVAVLEVEALVAGVEALAEVVPLAVGKNLG